MMSVLLILLLLLLLPSFPDQPPSESDIQFSNITINQGLSQNTVYCVLRDKQGFMWFGTEKGLNKYNGHSFNFYRGQPGIPGNLSYDMVLSLFESQSEPGIIWIGTWGGGLNRMNSAGETFEVFKHDPDVPFSIRDNTIRTIAEDQEGTLWLGTNKGISSFDRSSRTFNNFVLPLPDNCPRECSRVLSILICNNGIVLAGTDGAGIYFFDKSQKNFIPATPEKGPISRSRIRAMIEDKESRLWAGTFGEGLIRLESTTDKLKEGFLQVKERVKAGNRFIRTLFLDHLGYIWAGTHGSGIIRFNPESGLSNYFRYRKGDPGSLSNDIVLSILEDRESVLWIGTFGGGINKYYNVKPAVELIALPQKKHSTGQNAITELYTASDGKIWIGTEGGGLSYFHEGKNAIVFDVFNPNDGDGLSGNIIYAILEDMPDSLWLGTWGAGLYHFNHKTRKIRQYPFLSGLPDSLNSDRIICLSETNPGYLAIGTWGGGLNLMEKKTGKIKIIKKGDGHSESISNNKILALLKEREGRVWVGTEEGLNLYDQTLDSIKVYKKDPEKDGTISNNKILALYRDLSNKLWVGTEKGLNLYNGETGKFVSFGIKDGLYGESIHGILEDTDGNLWVSTNFGLNKFIVDEKKFLFFSARRGISRYEFSRAHSKSQSGRLMFGGVDGINIVKPEDVFHSRFIPEIVFTSFKKFGNEMDTGRNISSIKELVFSYHDSIVSFEFSALSFSDPGRNNYAYRIPGISNDWIYLGNKHHLSLIRLEPGEHQLTVKGTNSDGIWNEKGASIRLIVMPPFWQTWLFRAFVILFIISLVYFWHKGRMNRLKNKLKTELALDRLCMKKKISGREKEVMLLVIKGLSNLEIEEKLFISPHTVKNHIYNIFLKLEINSRGQLTDMFRNLYFDDGAGSSSKTD